MHGTKRASKPIDPNTGFVNPQCVLWDVRSSKSKNAEILWIIGLAEAYQIDLSARKYIPTELHPISFVFDFLVRVCR
jgi:hypothetical protein